MAADSLTQLRSSRLPWLIAGGALVLAGWLAWQVYGRQDHGDPIATSLTAFEKANRLTVFSAQLAPMVVSEDVRGFGTLESRQVGVIPARVDYTLDLSRLTAERFKWTEGTNRLEVTLPPLQISKPNLDEAKAEYCRSGILITGEAQAKLTRDNTIIADREATKQAANPALLGLAQQSAKQAVAQNLAVPLKVAGYGDISVTVRFEGEKEVR